MSILVFMLTAHGKRIFHPTILFKDFHPMDEFCATKLTIIEIHPLLSLSYLLFIGLNQCL